MLIPYYEFLYFIILEEIKEEPVTPMSASSMGDNANVDVKPPVPEPIQGGGGSGVQDKKRKCCKL